MSTPAPELLEMILRECNRSGDYPWYPNVYADATGVDRDQLHTALDQLRLSGLLELTPWEAGKGQGYLITESGEDVLQSPRLLNELRRSGELPKRLPPSSEVRGGRAGGGYQPNLVAVEKPASFGRSAAVRDALITPIRPWATQLFVALNVINFLIGMALASRAGIMNEFFMGQLQAGGIMRETGSFGGMLDVLNGNSWRLLTCCFVHAGIIHIGMNMYVLFSIGPMVERMFGSIRFIALYLVAGLGGSVTAAVLRPDTGLVGASGAICGLIGAMLTWVWLNKSYLPQQMASQWIRNIMMNIFLIAAIGFLIPRVSNEGHFGGGIAGLVVAVPLLYNRFGEGVQRLLGIIGAILVPVVIWGWLQMSVAAMQAPAGEANKLPKGPANVSKKPLTEAERFLQLRSAINQTCNAAIDVYNEDTLMFQAAVKQQGKVPEATREEAFSAIPKIQDKLKTTLDQMQTRKPFTDANKETILRTGTNLLENWQEYFSQLRKCVNEQAEPVPQEVNRLEQILDRNKTLLEDYRMLR